MPKTFVYTAITVKKQMPVEKSCSAVLNVHPVQPATKPVRISKRNGAADLIPVTARQTPHLAPARRWFYRPLSAPAGVAPALQKEKHRPGGTAPVYRCCG